MAGCNNGEYGASGENVPARVGGREAPSRSEQSQVQPCPWPPGTVLCVKTVVKRAATLPPLPMVQPLSASRHPRSGRTNMFGEMPGRRPPLGRRTEQIYRFLAFFRPHLLQTSVFREGDNLASSDRPQVVAKFFRFSVPRSGYPRFLFAFR